MNQPLQQNNKREIKIKGGGISGLTAAINLARGGYNVTMYEARGGVGIHREGDFQGLENWTREEDILESLRKFGIETSFPLHPWHEAVVVDHKRRRFQAHSTKPYFYLIRRGSQDDCLDFHLAKQAVDAGVKILYNARLEDGEADIVATGDTRRYLMIAHGYTFLSNIPDTCEVILDNDLAPVAYAYLISIGGKATITTCLTRNFRDADAYLEKTVQAYQKLYQIEMKEPKRFSCVGNFGVLKSRREKIVIGEAAGFQDAMAGFGMRYAFESGYLAAKAIMEGGDYWKMADAELYPWVRASIVNRFWFTVLNGLSNSIYPIFTRLVFLGNIHKLMRLFYKPMLLKEVFYPIAKQSMRDKLVS